MEALDWHRLQAPARWQAIDLLSDLHLSVALPRTAQAFEEHLASTDADAVLILGDLFEVWIGDDQRHLAFEAGCLRAIAEAARHRWIGFMAGNRDFLLGPHALEEARMHALADPVRLDAFGRRYLLTHGDALCLDDAAYQRFRQEVRQPRWQDQFLARPFDERAALAGRIRAESRSRKAAAPDPSNWADVDATAADRWLSESAADALIHGHTHRPGHHALPSGRMRHVLSDWDLDGGLPRAQLMRIDILGARRIGPMSNPHDHPPLAT